ncbi:YjcZ family sporulation protein [Bacillus sp. ISL-101]|uniref:YjcZ family sporulation protein n=1 Tax=Bacillus sp. ISL-101 TaxID=2819117 RepID=UPI0037BEB69B
MPNRKLFKKHRWKFLHIKLRPFGFGGGFVFIVVLFILLIIVGCSCAGCSGVCGYGYEGG